MTTQSHMSTIVLIGACFCSRVVSAQPDVLFLDGGYAELCSIAAHNLDAPQKIEITGSRLDVPALEICTLAIEGVDADALNLAASYNNRGVLHFAMGTYAEALSDFEQAIRLDETMAHAHVNRGYTLVALRRWEESIAAFDSGIALGTTEAAKAHFNRGIAHEETGNLPLAYQDYLKASELDPLWEEPKRELMRFIVSEN